MTAAASPHVIVDLCFEFAWLECSCGELIRLVHVPPDRAERDAAVATASGDHRVSHGLPRLVPRRPA